jgi:hypothetical protein
MVVTNSQAFKRRHGISEEEGLSLKEIAKLSGMPKAALQQVFNRGVGAFKTNPESVRPQVKSAEQWAFSRLYSFVMKRPGTFYGRDADIVREYNIK